MDKEAVMPGVYEPETIEAMAYLQVICPVCKLLMVSHPDFTVRCDTPGCKNYQIVYRTPHVTLERV